MGGKGGRCLGLTTLPSSCAHCLEIWEPHPSGTFRTCPGLYKDCFTKVLGITFLESVYELKKSRDSNKANPPELLLLTCLCMSLHFTELSTIYFSKSALFFAWST
jgi:hypothetical protein